MNKIHLTGLAAAHITDALQKNTVFICSHHSNLLHLLLHIKTIEELDLRYNHISTPAMFHLANILQENTVSKTTFVMIIHVYFFLVGL